MGVPRSLSWPAWPPRGSYLGVEEQRGRPQVFLLQDSHGVRHLPLLYPAGQQHRGLRTSPSCPGLHRDGAHLCPTSHEAGLTWHCVSPDSGEGVMTEPTHSLHGL